MGNAAGATPPHQIAGAGFCNQTATATRVIMPFNGVQSLADLDVAIAVYDDA